MNALAVYFSKFGNTAKVAQTIAEAMEPSGAVRMICADQLEASSFKGADLLVMGSPTHNMNLPKAVGPILEGLPKGALKGVHFAAFDTSYRMSWWLNYFTAAKKLTRFLRRLGGKRLASPATFLVKEREGPLYEGELDRAKAWAEAILITAVGKR